MERLFRPPLQCAFRISLGKKLKHRPPGLLDFRRVCLHLHALGSGGAAGRDRMRKPIHLNEAEPARACRLETAVVAKGRHLDAGEPGGLQQGRARACLDDPSVDT